MFVKKMSIDLMPFDKMSLYKIIVVKMTLDNLSANKIALDFMYEDEMYVGLDVCRQNVFRLNDRKNAHRQNALKTRWL
jgi:hypothetical protein